MSISEPPGGPPVQSPTSIDQLVQVITELTQLIKDQAADLRASKRLTRLLRAQQPAGERPARSPASAAGPGRADEEIGAKRDSGPTRAGRPANQPVSPAASNLASIG